MDVEEFCRDLWGGMDPAENFNDVENGEPSNLNHREDIVEGANMELTEHGPSAAVFAAAAAAEVKNQRTIGLGLGEPWDIYHGDFYLDKITDEKEAMENLEREFQSQNDIEGYSSNSNQHWGVEHAADDGNQADNDLDVEEAIATHEHGSDRAGDAEAVASSQLVSAHSHNHGRDYLDHSRTQEHSFINIKSSQEESCATLPEAFGDEDEAQSPSVANMDREELVSDPGVPRVGLEFCSEEAVYEFYNNYAKRTGFTLRRGKAEYAGSNKAIIKAKYFLCSCQGYKSKEQITKPPRYKRRDMRTGCEAKIKCAVSDGTWKISKVVLNHNHDLKDFLHVAHGRVEDSRAMTALSMNKIANKVRMFGEHVLVSDVDCSHVSRGTWKNHPMPELEVTQDLIDHFTSRQIEDPSFFYTLQVKPAPGMANFFWRDSRSMIDYEHFRDVLVLDTRTRINKYDMICAAFWGLNHHRQRIIFGCAFLVDQTVDSLIWLIQSFLRSMSWQKPQTIITEVSEEIADALRVVLPETSHCLPFWSIWNGFSKNLSALSDRPSVVNLFSDCVFHVHSQEEFEWKWNSFLGKYKLHENTWLASLYGMREKWSHAFTKNVFSAGLISTQNNEDARDIFGNLSCKTMTLSQIAHRCGKVAERMRMEEFLEDMRCEKITANLQSSSPVEKEAERLYTKPIFRMLRKELINSLSLAIEETGGTATLRDFKLTQEGSTKVDNVKFDPSNLTVVCSCAKFESVGILCFHALKVLNFKNIFKILPRYLMKRWTKSAKDSLPMDNPRARTAPDGAPDNLFMGEFMRQALHVAHMSVNKKRKRMAMGIMKLALEHIAKASKTEEVTVALDNSDGDDDMDQTICEYALETQIEQDNGAKSGMGCRRVKRKV